MHLLVTGGAGFIGSSFVRGVLHGAWDDELGRWAGCDVVVLDKLTYAGNLANLAAVSGDPRLTVVRGDVADAALVDEVVARVDGVVHLAAESHVDRSIAQAAPFVMTNVVGTQTLLDAALRHGVERFVQVSTDEVYGSIDSGAWDEGQLVELVGASWSQVEHVADRRGHDRRYALDWSRIADELGWAPRVGFEDGLAETVRWYAENRAWGEPSTPA